MSAICSATTRSRNDWPAAPVERLAAGTGAVRHVSASGAGAAVAGASVTVFPAGICSSIYFATASIETRLSISWRKVIFTPNF